MATPSLLRTDFDTPQGRAVIQAANQRQQDQLAAERARIQRHNRQIIAMRVMAAIGGGAAMGVVGSTGFGGAGAAAPASAAPAVTSALAPTVPAAAPVGTTAGLGGWSTPLFGTAANNSTGAFLGGGGGSTVANIVGGSGGGAGGFFRSSDLMRYGVPAGISAATSIYGTHVANSAAEKAAAEQQRQFALTQAFLEKQEQQRHDDLLAVEAEKKRQWEAEQAEKARRYAAQEPWREAGRGNLVRMNSLLDEPRPQRVGYQPTFQYRP